jgi:hypothetical protein
MSAHDRLTVGDVAALLDIAPSTFRAYVSRGQAPAPDGRFDGRTPYWLASTIAGWRP